MKTHKTAEMEKPRATQQRPPLVSGRLSGKELGKLAKRMVESKDPAETAALTEAMMRGFYGHAPHASVRISYFERAP